MIAAQNRQTTNNFTLLYTNLQIKLYKNIIIITCKGMAMIINYTIIIIITCKRMVMIYAIVVPSNSPWQLSKSWKLFLHCLLRLAFSAFVKLSGVFTAQ